MNPDGAKITGVVLAGGRGRRMGGADKGLVHFRGRPLAAYAIDALKAVTERILISANRNGEAYADLGYPVIADAGGDFDGPLAGLLSAMRCAETPYVLTVPCDCPLLRGALLRRLYDTLRAERADVCVAHDGERLHPVFMVARRDLAADLGEYLAGGGRKVQDWLQRHRLTRADFSDYPAMCFNLNTAEQLAALEENLETRADKGSG